MEDRDFSARLITGYAHASLQDGYTSMMKKCCVFISPEKASLGIQVGRSGSVLQNISIKLTNSNRRNGFMPRFPF